MTRKTQRSLGNDGYLLLAAIFGVATTLAAYRGYGAGNHIEQLPIILRQLDHTFLSNDFFTNAAANFIARLYYAKLVAILAGSEHNLPLLFLILTIGSNTAIAIITYALGRDLFNDSPLAGIYAAALVMSVSTFNLGWNSMIYADILIPATIACPFLLAAVWLLLRGKTVMALFLCGLASLIHPLFALEIGGVIFITDFTFHLIRRPRLVRDHLVASSTNLFVFTPFALVSLLPQLSQARIASNQFIYIVAYFRNPPRYVPSTFGLAEYISAAAFLSVVIVFYLRWRKAQEGSHSPMLAIIACLILLLCLGGYVFVEIFPVRIWVIAETFRLLYLIQWIGLILIAGTISGKNLESPTKLLYLASVLHPLSMGIAVLSQSLRERLEFKRKGFGKILHPYMILPIMIALVLWESVPRTWISISLLVFFVSLILAFSTFSQKLFCSSLLVGAMVVLLFVSSIGRLPSIGQSSAIGRLAVNLSLGIQSELGAEGDEVAAFVRQSTPEDSIFLTPPNWGQFRILARRAIVVDYEAFPFADLAIAEWYERLITCYGNPTNRGLAMVNELEENYRHIDDNTLLALQKKYKIAYAVLYKETPTSFAVLFQNSQYKVIRLGNE